LDIVDVMTRVARAVESVAPDLILRPYIGVNTLFEGDSDSPEDEWSRYLGFYMTYRGEELGNFGTRQRDRNPSRCAPSFKSCYRRFRMW
jgi:hypothetical protein